VLLSRSSSPQVSIAHAGAFALPAGRPAQMKDAGAAEDA
jgi:hypothetical protein